MNGRVRKRGIKGDTVLRCTALDAAPELTAVHQDMPAGAGGTSPTRPRLGEEGLPLEVTVELVTQFHAQVVQNTTDDDLHVLVHELPVISLYIHLLRNSRCVSGIHLPLLSEFGRIPH